MYYLTLTECYDRIIDHHFLTHYPQDAMNGQNVSLDPATGLPENEPQSDMGKEGGNEDILFEKLAEFINKNELGNAVQTRVLKTKVFFFLR